MKPITTFFISLVIVSFLVGVGFGFALSPSYQRSMYEKKMDGLGPADRTVDLRYIDQMAAHHRGAMLLAQQVQNASLRPEITQLATEILASEPKLIDELYTWKKQWYNDPRQARDPQVASLGAADDTLDLRFLNAVIAHHREGILMTQEIRVKSSRSEILNNADAVEQFLTGSLTTLEQWRKEWYNVGN